MSRTTHRGGRAGDLDRRGSGQPSRNWQAGFLVGSAIGAAATVVGHRAEGVVRRGMVDWPAAERIAIGRLRKAPGALSPTELRASEAAYAAAMARVVPRLAEALGTELPGVVGRVAVVDRATWVRANTASFAAMFGRLQGSLLDQLLPAGGGLGQAAVALAQRWVTTRQIGLLLGFLAARVLGQYDLALLSAEAVPGRLLFVEENIRLTARTLDVPLDAFRTWIALHETTHAFEFEAHPWLRPYLAERLERQLAAFAGGARELAPGLLRRVGRALRGERSEGHWMEHLMTDEQRRLFRETQAVMSLLEGFSDYIMDEVGRDLVPGVERISARFHARRQHPRSGFERAIMRLTGLDLKLEQYRAGATFVTALAARGGPAALEALWTGPQALPRDGEIEDPDRWWGRVMVG